MKNTIRSLVKELMCRSALVLIYLTALLKKEKAKKTNNLGLSRSPELKGTCRFWISEINLSREY